MEQVLLMTCHLETKNSQGPGASAAELRNPGGFVENVDFTKRGGRYQSDFIWNVDWQTQVTKILPCGNT